MLIYITEVKTKNNNDVKNYVGGSQHIIRKIPASISKRNQMKCLQFISDYENK